MDAWRIMRGVDHSYDWAMKAFQLMCLMTMLDEEEANAVEYRYDFMPGTPPTLEELGDWCDCGFRGSAEEAEKHRDAIYEMLATSGDEPFEKLTSKKRANCEA